MFKLPFAFDCNQLAISYGKRRDLTREEAVSVLADMADAVSVALADFEKEYASHPNSKFALETHAGNSVSKYREFPLSQFPVNGKLENQQSFFEAKK